MKRTEPEQNFSREEAERRATETLRRALTTPYKPQRELVGKKKRLLSKSSKSALREPGDGGA
jgi:hypothetical protein